MTRADKLREHARWLIEGVMKTDENFSQAIIKAINADTIRLELEAAELDELDEQNKRAAD